MAVARRGACSFAGLVPGGGLTHPSGVVFPLVGWLDRALGTIPEEDASPFRAVAMGPNLPRMLHGSTGAIAIPDLRQFKVQPQSAAMANVAEGGFEAMYAQTVDHALHGTGTETFEAIDMLRKIDTSKYPPENGADYPKS